MKSLFQNIVRTTVVTSFALLMAAPSLVRADDSLTGNKSGDTREYRDEAVHKQIVEKKLKKAKQKAKEKKDATNIDVGKNTNDAKDKVMTQTDGMDKKAE